MGFPWHLILQCHLLPQILPSPVPDPRRGGFFPPFPVPHYPVSPRGSSKSKTHFHILVFTEVLNWTVSLKSNQISNQFENFITSNWKPKKSENPKLAQKSQMKTPETNFSPSDSRTLSVQFGSWNPILVRTYWETFKGWERESDKGLRSRDARLTFFFNLTTNQHHQWQQVNNILCIQKKFKRSDRRLEQFEELSGWFQQQQTGTNLRKERHRSGGGESCRSGGGES